MIVDPVKKGNELNITEVFPLPDVSLPEVKRCLPLVPGRRLGIAILEGPVLDMVLHSLGLIERDVIQPLHPQRIAGIMKAIVAAFESPQEHTHIHVSKLAYELLLELSLSCQPRYPQSIDKALSYMESRLSGQLSSDQICRHVGLSATHFNRLFRAHLGTSPINYFTRQKLAWARHLLSETALSIKEIATMIGYDDPLYFSAQFKKREKICPRLFRQRKNQ